MAMNNTYSRNVRANPTNLNPNQHYVKEYDAGAELEDNLTKFGTQVANIYAKADYEAAKRDAEDEYNNRAIMQKDAFARANEIAEPRLREEFYNKEMDKINRRYGQNIDKRLAKEYASRTALDDKKYLFDLRVKATRDLQNENKLRSDKNRDNMAEQAAAADPAMAAEIDRRVQNDLAGMLQDGSISQYEMELKLEDYNRKKTLAGVNSFLDSAPEDWSDEDVDNTLNLLTANIASEKEREQLKGFAKAKIKGLKRQKEYLDTFNQLHGEYDLLDQSISSNLSIGDISRKMPANASKEYKSLIKSLNGYGDSLKLDDDEKLMIKNDLYDKLATLTSNAEATPKDYAALQNMVYKAMAVKAMPVSEGKKMLDTMIMPLNDYWGRQIDKLSVDDEGWFAGDLGMSEVKKYLEQNGWIKNYKKIAKETGKNKKLSADLKTDAMNNARVSIKAYRLYNNNLMNAARANGFNDISEVMALDDDSPIKRSLFRNAQDTTIKQMAQDRFSFLSALPDEQQPNKVLDNGSMVGNTIRANNAGLGVPVKDNRYKGTAFDAASGKYGLVRSDGTIEEVSYERYKQFGGLK